MATNTNPFYTYSATAGSSKTLQKPQDGGDNNQWGNYINTDLDEIVAAVNALSDKIADASENTLVDFTATGSAVNHVGITNAATGNPPQISSAGSDTNVDLTLTAKGTGDINLTPGTNGDVNIPASKGITFGDDGEKIEGDGTDLTIASSATLNVNTGSSSGNDLKVNTSQLVVEGDTGQVGVGIASPASDLHISAGGNADIKIDAGANQCQILMTNAGSNDYKIRSDNSPDGLIFSTNTADVLTIDSSANVTINDGNLVIGTAGQGITFGGDPDSRNSGVTAGDRTLYDYEEGTFTVTFSANSTSVDETFSYTKIGNQVTVVGRMIFSVGSGGPHTISTSSTLPFTPKANTSAILVSTMNRLIDNSTDGIQLLTNDGDSTLFLKRITTSGDAYHASGLNSVEKTDDSRTDAYSTFVGTYLTS